MLHALFTVLTPFNLLMAVLGSIFGMVFGVIPGLGPALGLALLIPMTYPLDHISALIVLVSAFGSAIYGGCISAILLKVPGTPGSVATTFDGYALAEKGKGAYAIGAATTGSAIGGIIGVLALAFAGPPIAKVSLAFGPADYFMLAIVGLLFISRMIRGNFLRGIISTLFGLALSFSGMDLFTGTLRYTFGINYLQDGVQFIPAVIGLFAVSQALILAEKGGTISKTGKIELKSMLTGVLEPFRRWVVTVRSALIGLILGTAPGIGISTANLLAYAETVRASKDPDSFGQGNIDGVIAPETANNAVEGGSLIPTLTLGIPGGATAAVFLGGLNLFGIQTGYNLFSTNAATLHVMIVAMILGNIMFFIVGLSLVSVWARLTVLRNEILVPLIMVMCILGSYTLRDNMGDVWFTLIMGVVGYLFTKAKFPIAPMVIALILGPIAEQGFTRAMLISGWSPVVFVTQPISIVLLVLGVFIAVSPLFGKMRKKAKDRTSVQSQEEHINTKE